MVTTKKIGALLYLALLLCLSTDLIFLAYLLLPRASEQGNVIGSVRIYIYMCVQKKL